MPWEGSAPIEAGRVMPHDVSLIATLAVGFALAFLLGFIAHRLRLPPIVGYLMGGVAMGRFTPGFVADSALVGQLAEIGVMLLMFGVGLHFSTGDLMEPFGGQHGCAAESTGRAQRSVHAKRAHCGGMVDR